jgi:signal transduction histidine kinase
MTPRPLGAAEPERVALARGEAPVWAVDEVLSVLAHELRTPLNAMLGWLRVLRAAELDDATRVRALEAIERNAEAQAQLLPDLVDACRLVAGTLRLEVGPVELTAVVAAALDRVRSRASDKGIRLVSALRPDTTISGDGDRLGQVVTHLLSNAIKFTPAGGQVTIALDRDGGTVRLSVEDTGQGIAPERLPHLFDRFRETDRAAARARDGLGLVIVRHLAELHGGTVGAHSAGEGRGATFWVTLPAPPPAPRDGAPGTARLAGPAPSG